MGGDDGRHIEASKEEQMFSFGAHTWFMYSILLDMMKGKAASSFGGPGVRAQDAG